MTKHQRSGPPTKGTWPLDDQVIRLRVFGTEQTYDLVPGPAVQILGSSSGCDVALGKQDGTVAARHARLTRRQSQWTIHAIDDQAGAVCRDRVALREFPLIPGLEIGIGKVMLIAESQRSLVLHRALARLLGFGASQRAQVDRALATVLTAASGRSALMLYGDGDLMYVARQLHRLVLDDRPFVVSDPRRLRGAGDARSARNIDDPMAAFTAAAGGSLCFAARRLPEGFERMVERWRRSEARVQLILCDRAGDPVLLTAADSIVLPPMSVRGRDRLRIIAEIAGDAAAELGVDAKSFTDADRRRVLESDAATLPDIERAIHRIIALRHWGVTPASRKLGMSHGALFEWAVRRGLVPGSSRSGRYRDRTGHKARTIRRG
jgi:hypothetical protein